MPASGRSDPIPARSRDEGGIAPASGGLAPVRLRCGLALEECGDVDPTEGADGNLPGALVTEAAHERVLVGRERRVDEGVADRVGELSDCGVVTHAGSSPCAQGRVE